MKQLIIVVVLAGCSGARSQYVYDPQPTASCGVLREYALPAGRPMPPAATAPATKAAERAEKASTRVASSECKARHQDTK